MIAHKIVQMARVLGKMARVARVSVKDMARNATKHVQIARVTCAIRQMGPVWMGVAMMVGIHYSA